MSPGIRRTTFVAVERLGVITGAYHNDARGLPETAKRCATVETTRKGFLSTNRTVFLRVGLRFTDNMAVQTNCGSGVRHIRVLLLSILGSDMSLYTDYRKDKEKRQVGR